MQVSHPSMTHMNNKELDRGGVEVPVHEVRPPEDEAAMFAAQMQAAEQAFGEVPTTADGVPPVMDESIMQKEVEKKNVLEKLVFFKKDHCKEFDIGGLNFKLRLLNSNDHSFINKLIVDNDIQEIYKRSLMTVAASIVSINSQKLEDFYSGPDIESVILKKYFELCQWHLPVTSALIDAYTKFQTEVESEFSKDFLDK